MTIDQQINRMQEAIKAMEESLSEIKTILSEVERSIQTPLLTKRISVESQKKVLLSVNEVSELLGLSRPTVYTLLHRSDFPSLQIGRRVMVNAKLLQKWVDEQVMLRKREQ